MPGIVLISNFGFNPRLSPVSPAYTENLALYLTSGQTFWRADLSGGNISVGSLQVPSSVSGYSIVLTHYSSWNSQYELFTKYGLGLLGPFEPNPNGTILEINGTSQADANTLANSLDQRFALAYQPYGTTANGFLYFSPIDFNTMMNVYFWDLVPTHYGGFASMFTQQQFESNPLAYYKLSYSSSVYSISLGGLMPLSSTSFSLYTQLGLTSIPLNYSSSATSSSLAIRVLGGLVNSTSYHWLNSAASYSSIFVSHSAGGNSTVPNVNGTLDFSFPTILAYRQVSSLTPSANSTDTVGITITNVSPSGPAANNVKVNDSWIDSYPGKLSLTVGNTSGSQILAPGKSFTVAYSFKVLVSNGTINIPATPVSYEFSAANSSITANSYLNGETLHIGAANTPVLETILTVNSGSIQAGQSLVVNINSTNRGDGTAFNLKSQGQSLANLPVGSTWKSNATSTPASLLQANANINYSVTWQDSSGTTHNSTTNSLTAVYSFSNPGTPALFVTKAISVSIDRSTANVTLSIVDDSTNKISNIMIQDPLSSGVSFWKSSNASSMRLINGMVEGNLSSLGANQTRLLTYSINITNTGQNFVFFPANATSLWNNGTISHFSNGVGLPIGVVGSKLIFPSQGFQGSNVTVKLGLVNKGSLPIYDVNLSSTSDPFLNVINGTSNFQKILNSGGVMSASLNANLTGNPGIYNSSSGTATFLFAGSNQSAITSTFKVTIYGVLQGNMSYSGAKIEENHPITIKILIYNPSNVTVSNVNYEMKLPSGLSISSGSGNLTNYQTLGPHSNYTLNFVVTTSQPFFYQINPGNLNFSYQGHTLKGLTTGVQLTIVDDLKVRYLYPIIVAILIILATAFYIRRLARKKS